MGTGIQRVGVAALLVLTSVAACSDDTDGDGASSGSTEGTSSSTTAAPFVCEREGPGVNECLGVLEGGTYETTNLVPKLTYEVGEGWTHYEDVPGEFLLYPPGAELEGLDPGSTDYLGVYPSVTVPGCDFAADPAVETTPEGFVAALEDNPDLTVSAPEAVTVGGLSGLRIVVEFPGESECNVVPYGGFYPAIVGVPPTSIQHGPGPELPLQMTLLANGDDVMLIEVGDAPDASDFEDWFAEAIAVQETFEFG
jgi:hypothetical protein